MRRWEYAAAPVCGKSSDAGHENAKRDKRCGLKTVDFLCKKIIIIIVIIVLYVLSEEL